jgi:hypothetical protein
MRWIKTLFLLALALGLAGAAFSLARLVRDPESFYRLLGEEIKTRVGARLTADEIKIAFAPFPALHLENPRLDSGTAEFPSLTAERAQFSFRIFPLIFGKAELAGFQVRGGKGRIGEISLEGLDFKIRGLKPNASAPFEWKGSVSGSQETFRGKGKLSYKNPGGNLWADLGVQSDTRFQVPSLDQAFGEALSKRLPQARLSGELQGTLHLEKERGARIVRGAGKFEVKDFRSGTSEGSPFAGSLNLSWNFEKGEVVIEQWLIQSAFGEADLRGNFRTETGEVEEVRLVAREIMLDELVRRFPALQTYLPVDVGFSGKSDFDLSLQGTWDYLSLHGNWDLAPAVLSYGSLFLKGKNFPMNANFDLLLKGGETLSGDFSIRIRQSTLKGALPSLDLKTGEGEITILTNKFDLETWEELLPAFAGYEFSGSAKVLLSFKGNLGRIAQTQKMLNLTLEGATLLSPRGTGVREAKLFLDWSPLNLRIKEAAFDVAGSPVQFDVDIYDLQEAPQGTLRATSPRLNLPAFVQTLRELSVVSPEWRRKIPWRRVQRFLKQSFPRPVPLEEMALDLKAQDKKIILQKLEFRALDGSFSARGEADWPAPEPRFRFETEVDRLSLAKLLESLGSPGEGWEGNLFLQGRFEGGGLPGETFSRSLKGQGSLSLTNGEWHGLSLKRAVAELGAFGDFSFEEVPDRMLFHDLKADWTFKEGKFESESLLIHSEDFWVEGKGSLSQEGALNLGLDLYLSKSLTQKVLDAWVVDEEAGGRQLGPMPFLVVGNLVRPELKPDERQMEKFLEDARARKFRKILREPFVKEESVRLPEA